MSRVEITTRYQVLKADTSRVRVMEILIEEGYDYVGDTSTKGRGELRSFEKGRKSRVTT